MSQSVFITGATVNTGRGIAERFAKEGYNLFLGSRSAERAESTAKEMSEKYGVFAKGYGMKVFDEENVKEIFADIKKEGYSIDCLVLNASNLGLLQKFFEVPVEEFMDVINTNVGWNFMLSRQAAIQMREKGGGSIVFVNSNTAYRAIPDRISYSASKSGALGMMRAMALDLGKYNIRVNAVLPGMIKTDRWENDFNHCREVLSNYTPLGDIADFEDIANAVYYFGSGMSKNTTGAELVVDGGNMIQLYPIIDETNERRAQANERSE
ncbi:MAG TPA: SDR family oxidoreductase [Candidatus Eisenbergiella merdipullorum]|uniref:SDR family oxidoreductase n=1 Tax=Candidatus Eisenbergiella merdipullorum TaxID=2838553 RepID=A0A9D2I888_9FIRM|nr:SDR family oxidoreductase [Candidatus Eisenbergiella merdipullorum]